jgi:DNA-binding transcriptional regulator YiaG
MAHRAKKEISKKIRKLRGAFDLRQEQFAAKVRVTVSAVNRWENSSAKPSPLAMLRIVGLLKS